MRNWLSRASLVMFVAVLAAAAQTPFQILTTHLPRPHQGQEYRLVLQAIGGKPPYTWSVAQGQLPAGLTLNAQTGEISGQPRSDAPFSVLIAVRDAADPPLEETRLLPSGARAPLTLQWTEKPQVSGQNLEGALEVRNDSGQAVRLTVIVVAVAEDTHKAFSLRYAHQDLNNQQSTAALPFSVFLPQGTYTVNVDAVGEVSREVIYRQHQEVPGMKVPGG